MKSSEVKGSKFIWSIRVTHQGLDRWTFLKGALQTSVLSWDSEDGYLPNTNYVPLGVVANIYNFPIQVTVLASNVPMGRMIVNV